MEPSHNQPETIEAPVLETRATPPQETTLHGYMLQLETLLRRRWETTLHGYMLQLENLLGWRWDEEDEIRTRERLAELSDGVHSLEYEVENEVLYLYLEGETQEPERLAVTFLGYYAALLVATEVHSNPAPRPETEVEDLYNIWEAAFSGMEEHSMLWTEAETVARGITDSVWELFTPEETDDATRERIFAGRPCDEIVVLDQLKTKEYEGEDERREEEESCSVCLEDLYKGSVAVLDCRHEFHLDCIMSWLVRGRNACPLCRATAIRR